jgi:hypothetical protein
MEAKAAVKAARLSVVALCILNVVAASLIQASALRVRNITLFGV